MGRKDSKPATSEDLKAIMFKALDVFKHEPRKQFNYKQIAAELHITDETQRDALEALLYTLKSNGELDEPIKGKFRYKGRSGYVIGKIELTASGVAYVVTPDLEEDVFISPKNLNRALNGDTVRVRLLVQTNTKKRRPEGQVVEIIEQGNRTFVGIIDIEKTFAFVEVDHKTMPYDIFVPLNKLKGATTGEKVTVTITDWPQRAKNPIGEVQEVLGKPGEHETEMHAILAEFELPYGFPEDVAKESEKISEIITADEIARRRDFRKITTFTIDPVDAKDFDDALSIQKLENGNWEIGVHIADVTHYVKEGDMIDREGYKRATSIYMVDRVVPMLPERLSNFICSLRPNEEKLCYSAVFEMDNNATVINEWFGRTVINSDRRFTYEEAQGILESGIGDFSVELKTMDTLAKKLRNFRFDKGAIAFDKKEVKFTIDEKGKPLGVYFKESKDANKLIEEFMLLANKSVAEYIGKKLKPKRTFVYRIHDLPDEKKLGDFATFIKQFGYRIETEGKNTSKSINKLLDSVRETKERNIIETLAVRAMAKAVYSTENVGHYGLAFTHYTHFTSPIRRYPDMMVHRLLDYYLKDNKTVSAEEWESKCKHSSAMEQRAVSAERASIKYKQVEFMQDKIGQDFDGVISGVTEWGMFVELTETQCEGLVSVRDLDDDVYIYDEKNYCLIGKYKRKHYRLGDAVKVKVAKTNLVKKQLDFVFVETEQPVKASKNKKK